MTGDVGDEVVATGPAALDGQNDAKFRFIISVDVPRRLRFLNVRVCACVGNVGTLQRHSAILVTSRYPGAANGANNLLLVELI